MSKNQLLETIIQFTSFGSSSANERPVEVQSILEGKIQHYVAQNKAIEFVLPAFPAKSANRKKTIGPVADFGEVLGLQRLESLSQEISKTYPPGAKIKICSDGRVFSDLVGVSDTAVNAYSYGIKEIIEDFSLNSLSTFDLDDVFKSHTFDEMRNALVEEFATPIHELSAEVKSNEGAKQLFNGIHRFIFEDQLSFFESSKSRTQIREASKLTAYQVIQRSQAWSTLVEKFFPEALRLSIHPQLPESTKIPVRLIRSENIWRTPWHGAVVFDGEEFRLSTQGVAREQGASLHFENSQWAYFDLRTAS